MTPITPRTRQEFLDRPGTLCVVRPVAGAAAAGSEDVDLFLVLADDGSITAFNGHVDLGTGIRTALAQIVAEELDVPVGRVTMVLGDTETAPNQGPTIASETIQVSAVPLRRAAAQARLCLVERAARALRLPRERLRTADGCVFDATAGVGTAVGVGGSTASRLSYESLLEGLHERLILSDATPVKEVADYRIVGQSVQRVDIGAKATGEAVYVHDVRVPSMLHGRVVRPPYAGMDSGPFVGTSLVAVDESSLAGLAGIVAVVVIGDFVGIVAEGEAQAAEAAERLQIEWKPGPRQPDLNELRAAVSAHPGRRRVLVERGEVGRRIAQAQTRLERTYVWPFQLHASIGPSCAVADVRADRITVWSGTQNPLPLRADLALLMKVPETSIEIIRHEASGCYGRNCADDVAADAALLSRAVRRPVRVQLTRAQEHLWEPKGAGQVIEVDGGLAADGSIAAYDFSTCYPSNASPTLALLLTGAIAPVAAVSDMGDRTAIPPYRYDHLRVVVNDMAPIVRASWLRGVSAMPNSFAHECYIDELATAAGVDAVEFRLRHLDDARAADLIRAVAKRAGWQPHDAPRCERVGATRRRGQGVAYARYIHGKFPGTAAAWSAWVAEVEVDIDSGEVQVSRVVVGQDTGLVINPAGVQHQIHGNVIQSISRTIKEEVRFEGTLPTARDWGTYPILTFPEVPVIQVVMMPRPQDPPLGAGESASVPSAAAIANAIFDATGVRMREPPFTPERMREALREARVAGAGAGAEDGAGAGADDGAGAIESPHALQLAALRSQGVAPQVVPRRLAWWQRVGGAAAVALGLATALFTWRPAMPPTAAPDPLLYSAETIERGANLAALGDCAVCHTAPGGMENAGGRRLETPFGDVYASNITPDVETGIGNWSYAAFERSMREGIHRDGRHLYPAFPYTAFTRTSDHDLQALYAYLMSRPPVAATVPATRLAFPFNLRPLMAFWNALFLRVGEVAADPARSSQWNRGAYLVEGLAHCSACHSPRNRFGAELAGARHFAGGHADGWDAPALTALSASPIPWSEAELYSYLKTGVAPLHGIAGGPMQAVTANTSRLPDDDVRAMAHYLASYSTQLPAAAEREMAQMLEDRELQRAARERALREHEAGARLFEGACASCHEPDAGLKAATRPSLALNTNLHSADPTNVRRAILEGVNAPALAHFGAMPAFRGSFDARQMDQLLAYLRSRFAGDQPAWPLDQ